MNEVVCRKRKWRDGRFLLVLLTGPSVRPRPLPLLARHLRY